MAEERKPGTGEPGWTEEEKARGSAGQGDAGEAGEAVPKAGYGGDDRAATEAAAAQVERDSDGQSADPKAPRNPA